MSVPPLIAACWTSAGNTAPGWPDERSPFDIRDRVHALADAGWSGLGIVNADLLEIKDTIGYAELGRQIRAAGLEYIEVEFLGDWWETGELRAASDRVRRNLLEAAEGLGAQTIKVAGKMFSREVDLAAMREAFDQLANEAREVGARVALESLPFTSFPTVRDGSRFVTDVGNPNGGMMVDIWHVYRAGNTPDDMLRDMNPAYLFAVELNDALEPAPPDEELWDDTINERRLPGEGDWDVPRFIGVMRELGFEGAWGVEVISHEHRAKSLRDAVDSAARATRAVFAEADRRLAGQ